LREDPTKAGTHFRPGIGASIANPLFKRGLEKLLAMSLHYFSKANQNHTL